MQFLSIISLCVFLAVTYGIIHDQITARICVEYFTIGHAPIFGTNDPTLLGLGWGVLATWWVGIMLGLPLAVVARFGSRPKQSAISLIRPLLLLMVISAICAVMAGTMGGILARHGLVQLIEPMASKVPAERQVAFLIDLWAHNASYLAGFVGGGLIIGRVWYIRKYGGAP